MWAGKALGPFVVSLFDRQNFPYTGSQFPISTTGHQNRRDIKKESCDDLKQRREKETPNVSKNPNSKRDLCHVPEMF